MFLPLSTFLLWIVQILPLINGKPFQTVETHEYTDTWDYKLKSRDNNPLLKNFNSTYKSPNNGTNLDSRRRIRSLPNYDPFDQDLIGPSVIPLLKSRPSLMVDKNSNLNITQTSDQTSKETDDSQETAEMARLLWQRDEDMSSKQLPIFFDKALRLFNLKQVAFEVENSLMSKVSCTACKAGAGLLQHYVKEGKSENDIRQMVNQFCTSLKIQTPRVCQGVAELFTDGVVHVLRNSQLGPKEICSFIIGDGCGDVYNPYHDWEVVFPPVPKPKVIPPKLPKAGAPSFKVLQLSDVHWDPYYAEGSNADCDEPLCCRITNGAPKSKEQAAGKWGDYRKCDSPKITIDHMYKHIQDTHPDIDYILWTGDLPPHDIWNQTREINLMILRETVKEVADMFPGIPIFPVLGNHETVPVNSFPPPFMDDTPNSIKWLYDALEEAWRRWLPASVAHTLRRGAFYSVLVRPGFRLISLNMNYANNKNWWLLINSTDPATELQWLIYELQSAEFNGEKVHILGHIPPGHSDALKIWSRNFHRIINRYEGTVTAQFYGHTHYDEFEVFYDNDDPTRANNIAFIGPSVTTYYDLNPGYRIYYVDGDHPQTTRSVLDHETWVMNLREANVYGYPLWYKLYSERESFKMQGLRPQDFDGLIQRLVEDPSLFNMYYEFYYKASPVRPNCDIACKRRLLCDLKSARSHDRKVLCEELESRIDGASGSTWKDWIMNTLSVSLETNDVPAYTEPSTNSIDIKTELAITA